ncbi:MAG: phosphatidate cytidylyltransferase [Clostridiales bacterium]|nr:phosphatidate cytidylyltransferase [Clostridiales bacterium]
MRQRVITGVLFTVAVVAFVLPSYWVPAIIVLFGIIVETMTGYEMINALKAGGMKPSVPLVGIGGAISIILILIAYLNGMKLTTALSDYLMIMMMFVFACVVIPSLIHKEGPHLMDGLVTGCTVLYITFPMFCLCAITLLVENGWFYMVPALFSSWISDTFAYFVGVTLGKHKIVPHISPKKTWEGCIGGALATALIVTLYFDLFIYRLDNINIHIAVFTLLSFFLGFVMSVMSQLGDWTASLIKRRVGIKDYGNIFPGHGGMLDRFDSAFFAIPTGVFLSLIAVLFI